MKVTQCDGYILVNVRVVPRSSKNMLDLYGDIIKIKLKSPPVEGKANKELVKYLSKFLGVNKRYIEIKSGETSKSKVLKISNINKTDFIKLIGGKNG